MEATSYIMYIEDEPAHKSAIIVSGLTGFPLFVPSEQNCVLFKEDAISTHKKKTKNKKLLSILRKMTSGFNETLL